MDVVLNMAIHQANAKISQSIEVDGLLKMFKKESNNDD